MSTFLVTAYYNHNIIYDNKKCFSKHIDKFVFTFKQKLNVTNHQVGIKI